MKVKNEVELFGTGDKVLYSGEYILVDKNGNKKEEGYEITLDEGEKFPPISQQGLFYMLNDTCLDEPCEIIGEPVEETE